jgi:hypothetical protein
MVVHIVQHSVEGLRRIDATSKDCGGVDVVAACGAAAGCCGVDWQGAGTAAKARARVKLKRREVGWCEVRVLMVREIPSE